MNWERKWDAFQRYFITNEGYKDVLEGLENTFYIAIFGFLMGLAIGIMIALIKEGSKRNKFTNAVSYVFDLYVMFFRGTPIVVQLLVIYYVLFPLIGVSAEPLIIATVTFGLNSGAYVSEIIRAGIGSIDKGQFEAGRSLGLSFTGTMTRIVLPQALKNSLPSLGNEIITLTKDTSVAGFIAVLDLTAAFQLVGSSTYDFIVPYLVLAGIYLAVVMLMTMIVRIIERRLKRSDRRN